jgi:hypothetical protein
MIFHGPIVSPEAVPDFNLYLQLNPGQFMGSAGDIDDYINHSCDPNTILTQRESELKEPMHCLVALQSIRPGDPITFDYSTTMSGRYWTMKCACGAKACRGTVRDFCELPLDVQVKLSSQRAGSTGSR